jgi:hypothetical protein
MRVLLAAILTFLPVVAQGKSFAGMGNDEPDSHLQTDLLPADQPGVLTDEFWLSGNPYSPASPTNFEAFLEPYLFVQGREGIMLYDPRSPSTFTVSDREWTSQQR